MLVVLCLVMAGIVMRTNARPGHRMSTSGALAARPRPRRVPLRRHLRWRTVAGEVAFYLAVTVVVLVALFPFYWILRTSLLSDSAVGQGVGGPTACSPPT